MWKSFAVVMAALLCVSAVAAAGPGATLGVARTSAGINGWSASSGVDAGVSVGLGTVKGVGIQPELRFVRRTAGRTLGGDAAALSASLSVDYVELPVLLRVRVGAPRRVVPSVYAGAYGAYRTRARFITKAGDISSDADAASDTRRWQSGVVVGAGVEMVGRGSLTWIGEARYTRDFTTLGTSPVDGEGPASALRMLAGVRWK